MLVTLVLTGLHLPKVNHQPTFLRRTPARTTQRKSHRANPSARIPFSVPRQSCTEYGESGTVVNALRNWLRTHEEAQVMLASVLVVVGLWWLVRTVLTLFINLILPLLVVILAVVCVPQLRSPLLGQNYPVLAKLLKNILLKIAENIKT